MSLQRYFALLVLLVCAFSLNAQLNPVSLFQDISTENGGQITIKSLGNTPKILDFNGIGYDTTMISSIGNNEFLLEIYPEDGYTGNIHLAVEYYAMGPIPGFPLPNYSDIYLQVLPSVITVNDEVILTNGSAVAIDVVQNDLTTASDLSLSTIAIVDGGSAIMDGNNIQFNFDSDSDMGFISYILQDNLGTSKEGQVRVLKTNDGSQDISLQLHNKESIAFYIADDNASLIDAPSNGTLTSSDNIQFTYTPFSSFTGIDLLSFGDGNGVIDINFDIVDKSINTSFVKDDFVYTSINEAIQFNVLENDYRQDFQVIEYSPELTLNGDGSFTFTPDVDFNGTKLLYYKIFSGLTFQTANIIVTVDDYVPTSIGNYKFVLETNGSMVIEHEAPIDGYYFEVLTQANHVNVEIIDSTDSNDDCGLIENSSVRLSSNDGYTGEDYFELNYCTVGGNCSIVKVELVVTDDYNSCACPNDCVWSGDVDNNGVVNARDLIALGIGFGEGGIARESTSNSWQGVSSYDWGFNIHPNLTNDKKHLDSNGDGFVTEQDFNAVFDHYGFAHQFVSEEVYAYDDVPIILDPVETEVDSGEVLHINILLGTNENPALDFYGMAFQFNIDPALIDSSSVQFDISSDTWVDYDSPLIDFYHQAEAGQIDVSMTRLSGASVTGSGIIGVLSFIVEDEVSGLRDDDGIIALPITITKAKRYNSNLEATASKDAAVKLYIDSNTKEDNTQFEAVVFPNPIQNGLINIKSNQLIQSYSVASSTGSLLEKSKVSNQQSIQLNTDLMPGVYFLTLYSNDGLQTTTKFVAF